jgi:hypothetical protein
VTKARASRVVSECGGGDRGRKAAKVGNIADIIGMWRWEGRDNCRRRKATSQSMKQDNSQRTFSRITRVTMSKEFKIIIVGGGIAGLATVSTRPT